MVKASAGTGKTTVMIDRILYLMHRIPDLKRSNQLDDGTTIFSQMGMPYSEASRLIDKYWKELTRKGYTISEILEKDWGEPPDNPFAAGFQRILKAVLGQFEEKYRKLKLDSNAVTDMTNEMFRRNAETLKQGAVDAALASERAIVDVETLKKVNADIIASINEVVKIHEDGSRRRAEAQEELAKIEDELKQALLQAGLSER